MILIDSNSVCDQLGISKSTLYKWCNIVDESILPPILAKHPGVKKLFTDFEYDLVTDFPSPYKIGSMLKWNSIDIEVWLKTKRVKHHG